MTINGICKFYYQINVEVLTTNYICNFCHQISVEIFGAKTQAIFDNVFDKMVAAAQPIPGFRRVKGGKIFNLMYILSWRSLGYVW